jgi:hypothetical protein
MKKKDKPEVIEGAGKMEETPAKSTLVDGRGRPLAREEEPRPERPPVIVNLGGIMRSKIQRVPVFDDKDETRDLAHWVEMPWTMLTVAGEWNEDQDIALPVSVYSGGYQDALSLLDYMIGVGKEGMETDGVRVWLHAVQHAVKRVIGKALYKVELRYIFRLQRLPETISEEVKQP